MILAKKPFKKTSEFVNDTEEAMIPTSTEAKIQLRGGSIAIVVLVFHHVSVVETETYSQKPIRSNLRLEIRGVFSNILHPTRIFTR